MKRLFITGGHATPAFAVISALNKRDWEIFYIGRKYALEGDSALSQEYEMCQRQGITFKPLISGRLQRYFTFSSIKSLLKIPLGFFQALKYIRETRPTHVLSFGGYVAVPVVLAAWIYHIPIVTHEQTLAPGLANKFISYFAKKICIGWEELTHTFPLGKTVFTGNPLRLELFKESSPLNIMLSKPLIYITGGSLGAHTINEVITGSIDKLLEDFSVVHQTGNSREYKDFEKALATKKSLSKEKQSRYLPIQFVTEEHIGWLMKAADIVIGRSGANTVTEIIALQKVAVFIPLPWSGANEQELNARLLTDKKAALLLLQSGLNSDTLIATIKQAYKERANLKQHIMKENKRIITDSAERIVHVIES